MAGQQMAQAELPPANMLMTSRLESSVLLPWSSRSTQPPPQIDTDSASETEHLLHHLSMLQTFSSPMAPGLKAVLAPTQTSEVKT